MPTWAISEKADPRRLAGPRLPCAGAQLSGPGRPGPGPSRRTPKNPFCLMVPEIAYWPLVLLATAATIIASQAVITGAFSMTQQAVQLGLLPRIDIRAHVGDPGRPDLRAAGQQPACWSGVLACCCSSRLVERPGRRLWHRGDRHDVRRHAAGLIVMRDGLEMAAVRWRRCSSLPFAVIDLVFLALQPAEDRRRRLAAAGPGRAAWSWSCGPGRRHAQILDGQDRAATACRWPT